MHTLKRSVPIAASKGSILQNAFETRRTAVHQSRPCLAAKNRRVRVTLCDLSPEAHPAATGATSTLTSIACAPEPSTTPSTGATSA